MFLFDKNCRPRLSSELPCGARLQREKDTEDLETKIDCPESDDSLELVLDAPATCA